MSRPGSDDSPGSSPLAAPAAASEDARDQALSLARESVQAEVAAFGEEQREQLRLKFKSLDEIEGGFGTALVESFPDFLPRPEMLKKTRQVLAYAWRSSRSSSSPSRRSWPASCRWAWAARAATPPRSWRSATRA